MTSAVEVTTTGVVAGSGLVARRRFEAGQVVALYPIHALGYAQGREPPAVHSSSTDTIVGTSDLVCHRDEARQFGVDCDDTECDYSYSMLDPSRRYVFDVNPARPLANDLFVAHFVNDAAAASFIHDPVEMAMIYLGRTLTNFNCVMTPLGPPPLMAYVTTKPVEEGTEFLASYGLDYWLGKMDLYDDRLKDTFDSSPEVQRLLEQYETVIDSAVEQATAIVRSDRYKGHAGIIRETIQSYRSRRPWRQRLRRWWRR